MAAKTSIPKEGRFVVGVFHDADAFVRALGELLERGFDRAAVSVLADHGTVQDHFGRIPEAKAMTDRADTPREDLDTEGALHAAIRFIAETVAIVGGIGAAGIAYAVGGPVGVASGASTVTDLTVNDVMARYVDGQYHARFGQSVGDGGVVCWVHVRNAGEAKKAEAALDAHGGKHVHQVDL